MKIRSNLIAGVIIVLFLMGGSLRAQGIYSTNSQSTTSAPAPMDKNGTGGIYRDLGDGGGTTGDGDPAAGGNDDTPIGGGILILSLLSGGYALLKKSVRGKHEE